MWYHMQAVFRWGQEGGRPPDMNFLVLHSIIVAMDLFLVSHSLCKMESALRSAQEGGTSPSRTLAVAFGHAIRVCPPNHFFLNTALTCNSVNTIFPLDIMIVIADQFSDFQQTMHTTVVDLYISEICHWRRNYLLLPLLSSEPQLPLICSLFCRTQ